MQLVHMDVSLPSNNSRQIVGPLSSGLNAVIGPRGSGKTRLVRWLRQVTAESYGSEYVPTQQLIVDLVGDVELRNHGSSLRLSRDANGRVRSSHTTTARNTVNDTLFSSVRDLTARQRQAFAMLADVNDGATDAQVALDEIALRLGLDARVEQKQVSDRDLLVNRESDLVARLDGLQRLHATREDLTTRRRDIEHKLNLLRDRLHHHSYDPRLDRNRLLDRYASIEADLHGAEAELLQVDQEIARVKAELKQSEIGQSSVQIEQSYREQLQQLEDRLTRWRKTLRDMKAHRESIENQETEAKLDQQVGTQLSGSLTADPRASMRSLEAQLHNARKQLDELIGQYLPPTAARQSLEQASISRAIDPRTLGGYHVQRDPYGRTHISYDSAALGYDANTLPEMLRSMQRDLHDICHQLSRQEAANTAVALRQQVEQLRRCESELLCSVEKLIEERGLLLRRIADRYNLTSDQVSLTFGDWCQCADHPHLYEWLVQEEAPRKLTREVDGQARARLEETLSRLEAQRREASLRAEECRRQLREANRARVATQSRPVADTRQAEEAELLRELDTISVQLADLENRDRLVSELDEVRRQLSRTPATVASVSEYRQAVDRNIVGLCGTLYQAAPTVKSEFVTSRQYDTVNGVVVEQPLYRNNFEVPAAIVRTAQRLAIGQLLALRGDTIPVILDQTLDGMDSRLQHAAVPHLALASQRNQIVVLTDDSSIADLVRQFRGNVVGLQQVQAKQSLDVNRQLAAYANDEEADKWYHPAFEPIPRRTAVSEFYLSANSPITNHPGIRAEVASSIANLGITSIGDLLEVDPQWLADNLQLRDVSAGRVAAWQATADLLTSVRNLRPFDARILVGSGVRSAAALSSTHPSELADRVEDFLTSEIGRKILQSGNRFEVARVKDWVASARRGSSGFEQQAGAFKPASHYRNNGNGVTTSSPYVPRRDYEADDYDLPPRRTSVRDARDNGSTRLPREQRNAGGNGFSGSPEQNQARNERRSPTRDHLAQPESARSRSSDSTIPRQSLQATARSSSKSSVVNSSAAKFYLDLTSPVVDAPSIGDRMAEKLNSIGITTVQQLIAGSADSIAQRLNVRRVTSETIKAWQDQARLVCRIPNLRGHDAQMLVACGITTPEALRSLPAETVLSKVSAFAASSEGQRILRGSREPDLVEVKDWLAWAGQSRSLNAA